jgi:hypothetical protein
VVAVIVAMDMALSSMQEVQLLFREQQPFPTWGRGERRIKGLLYVCASPSRQVQQFLLLQSTALLPRGQRIETNAALRDQGYRKFFPSLLLPSLTSLTYFFRPPMLSYASALWKGMNDVLVE